MAKLFTEEELEELRRADAEPDEEFSLTQEDIEFSRRMDREAKLDRLDNRGRRKAARSAAYREANKEKIADYQAAYREANKEKIADYQAAYREANKEKIADYQAAYREANKEKIADYQAAYYEANKEKIAAQKAAYYEANKEKIAAQKAAYYEANKEKIAAQKAAYYEANKEKIAAQKAAYAQSDNPLVGYSSINVNDKTDIMRGSMNQTESGPLEDNSGYRFVFDFETSQANGTISSVGLTSKWGGIAGYGSAEFANTQSPLVFEQTLKVQDIYAAYSFKNMLHFDEETGIATSMYVSGQNTITVTKFQLHTKKWRLLKLINMIDETETIDTQVIETEVFAGTSATGKYLYYNFCDSGDGFIWGFEHTGNAAGNSSGKASVNWIKIKVDDLTFEEGTWEIDGQLYYMGCRVNAFGVSTATYRNSDQANCVVLDGYLYCFNSALTGVYKINLSNVTDIKFVEHPDKKVFAYSTYISSGTWHYGGVSNLVVTGNKVHLWNGYLNGDVIVKHMYSTGVYPGTKYENYLGDGWIDTYAPSSYPFVHSAGLHPLKMGVFSIYYNSTDTSVRAYILLNSPYLATINNLPTPVEKTADKTMKITYILREEI